MSLTGRTILHYKVGEPLGKGGMGEVYLAEDTRLGRSVALKFLRPSYEADPESRQRLMQEARAASILRSPHVAVTYDIAEHDGAIFIVMEHVEGELLSERLERGPLAVGEAIDFGMQVADALDEAHTHGIVHRDVKTSNLIVTQRGLLKVLDFGLAKFIGSGSAASNLAITMEHTAAGVVLGTVSYMSPEQALGRPVDHRTDLFSLGVVLFEMLAGKLPFEGNAATEVIDRILHQDPPSLARLDHRVTRPLESIVRKALAKDQAHRYPTARQLYLDLQWLAREQESGQLSITGGLRPSDPYFGMLGNGLARPIEVVAPAPDPEDHVAVITFSNITGESGDDWIGSGIAETVTADLAGVHGLSVIGRARIFEVFKGFNDPEGPSLDQQLAIEVGRRVGASWIVGGGYQRIGQLVRITAELVDVRSGALLKNVKIDGEIEKIFELQDKIVYELLQGLNLKPGRSDVAQIEHVETQSVEAYESYSRGMMSLRAATRDSLDRAIYLFEKAIEQDANYASAWAALGAAYSLKGAFLTFPELIDKAIECERRAIGLDPRHASAYGWLGMAFTNMGRYDEAIEATQEALRLDPKNAAAHAALGRAYWVGKAMLDEAVAELELAATLNPEGGYAFLQLGFLQAIRGRYVEAEAACRRAIELQEQQRSGSEGLQILGAYTRLGYVYYLQGRYDDAIRQYESGLAFLATSDHLLRDRTLIEINHKIGAAHLRKGSTVEAERYFETAIKRFKVQRAKGADDPFTKYYVAALYGLRGDGDRATKYLGETFEKLRAINSLRAGRDPDFDGVRDHPAFRRLLDPSSVTSAP